MFYTAYRLELYYDWYIQTITEPCIYWRCNWNVAYRGHLIGYVIVHIMLLMDACFVLKITLMVILNMSLVVQNSFKSLLPDG